MGEVEIGVFHLSTARCLLAPCVCSFIVPSNLITYISQSLQLSQIVEHQIFIKDSLSSYSFIEFFLATISVHSCLYISKMPRSLWI